MKHAPHFLRRARGHTGATTPPLLSLTTQLSGGDGSVLVNSGYARNLLHSILSTLLLFSPPCILLYRCLSLLLVSPYLLFLFFDAPLCFISECFPLFIYSISVVSQSYHLCWCFLIFCFYPSMLSSVLFLSVFPYFICLSFYHWFFVFSIFFFILSIRLS